MECPRCHFENMPGLTACFRCGSVLTSGQVTIDVHPPRAPAIGKPFRSIQRWLRRWVYLEKVEIAGGGLGWGMHSAFYAILRSMRTLFRSMVTLGKGLSSAIIPTVLSIVPGFLQIAQGRFKDVQWYCLAWLILIGIGAFMYGSSVGLFAIGLAVGLHAWLSVMGWKLVSVDEGGMRRLRVVAMAVFCFGLLYWLIGARVSSFFPGSAATFDIPKYEIRKGDFLLGRTAGKTPLKWTRGTVVLAEVFQLVNYGRSSARFEVIGQIVGLPGEKVVIKKSQYFVNDQPLDTELYPVPAWLKDLSVEIHLQDRYHFVSCEYTLAVHGANPAMIKGMVHDACVMREDRILAKMTLRWLPLWRRGYLKESP